MSKLFTILILTYNSHKTICQNIDVYDFPGLDNSVLEMTRHPGNTDLKDISVCLRYIYDLYWELK